MSTHTQFMIGRNGKAFATMSAAAWPPQLCQWLAQAAMSAIIAEPIAHQQTQGEVNITMIEAGDSTMIEAGNSASDSSTTGLTSTGSSTTATSSTPSNSTPTHSTATSPRRTTFFGKHSEFHDGAGLVSPGRFDPDDRIRPHWPELQDGFMEIAARHLGGESGMERWTFESSSLRWVASPSSSPSRWWTSAGPPCPHGCDGEEATSRATWRRSHRVNRSGFA